MILTTLIPADSDLRFQPCSLVFNSPFSTSFASHVFELLVAGILIGLFNSTGVITTPFMTLSMNPDINGGSVFKLRP